MNIAEAQRIAQQAHQGQKYGSRAYIEHVADVVYRVTRHENTSEDAVILAWLHDVVEDSLTTVQDLRDKGASRAVCEALEAITRRPEEPYGLYIARVSTNHLARLVKLADLESNLANKPAPNLAERYRNALRQLSAPPPIEDDVPRELATVMASLNEVIRDNVKPRPYMLLVLEPPPAPGGEGKLCFVTNASRDDMCRLMADFIKAHEAARAKRPRR